MNLTKEELDYIFQIALASVKDKELKKVTMITSPSEKSSDYRLLNDAREALNIICRRNKCVGLFHLNNSGSYNGYFRSFWQ